MNILRKRVLLIIALSFFINTFAQHSIKGIILDTSGSFIEGATIEVIGNKSQNTVSNTKGEFSLSLSEGDHTLVVNFLGFKETYKNITSPNSDKKIEITLTEDTETLENVLIVGKTKNEEKRSSGFALDILETQNVKTVNADINHIIKDIPGVNLREAGGLGSNFRLSLNGLAGNQIRYFIDGIPMENFGTSLTLNNFPINLIQSVEIYKGVVPISLGIDALGGAINILTSTKETNYLDAMYSFGSFNTHRASVNTQYVTQSGHYFKLFSFFNYSDNNYLMKDVPVFDLELGNFEGNIDIKRFNDLYVSSLLSAEYGIRDKRYADQLYLRIIGTHNKKNYQHPDNNILRVLGDFHTQGNTTLLSTYYRKKINRLGIQFIGLVGQVNESNDDTSTRKFNWAGDFIERNENDVLGELGTTRSLFKLTDQIASSQFNIKFAINDHQTLEGNYALNYLRRKGKDEVNPMNFSFREPSSLSKNIIGLSYTIKDSKDIFNLSAFGKQYLFLGKETDAITEEKRSVDFAYTGYGSVLAIHPIPSLTIKASYEKSFRLPESYELLGNGLFILPNFELQPEESDNINLGVRFNKTFSTIKLTSDTNLFYRESVNFIRLKQPEGVFSEFDNITNVTSQGIESGINLLYKNTLEAQFNITYQDIIDKNRFDEGFDNSAFDSRVPNIPYFFWNTRLGAKFLKNKQLTFYWSYSFVESFFLKTENNGNPEDKNDIPAQHIQGLDIDYSWNKGKYTLSASVNNLTDELVFDNFRIQKPGRAFYLNFRYVLP